MHDYATREDLRRFESYCPNIRSIDFTMVRDKIDDVDCPVRELRRSRRRERLYPSEFGDFYLSLDKASHIDWATDPAWQAKDNSNFSWVQILTECPLKIWKKRSPSCTLSASPCRPIWARVMMRGSLAPLAQFDRGMIEALGRWMKLQYFRRHYKLVL